MKNNEGDTPVHLALKYWNSNTLIRELVERDLAALEVKNDEGNTPPHAAAEWWDSDEFIQELAQFNSILLC